MGGNISQRIIIIGILILFSFSLMADEKQYKSQHQTHLQEILKTKFIRFITTPSAFDFYIYQGESRGYQYELAKRFVAHLNQKYLKKDPIKIRFEMIPLSFIDMITALREKKGDVIAANLTITHQRQDLVAFTKPIKSTQEIIVTRKELQNELVWRQRMAIRKGTSFFEHIMEWNQTHPEKFLAVDYVDKSLEIENILELVAYGKYDYAMTDSHIFEMANSIHPKLVMAKNQPFKKDTLIAWATNLESTELLKELNAFIPKVKEGSLLGNIFQNRYFNDLSVISDARNTRHISEYDSLIKKYSKKYDLDWRLMSALAFQESRFNAGIINRWGAIGLFQIKEATANEPYVAIKKIKGKKNVENNIHAGIKYFAWIRDNLYRNLKGKDKIKFSLATYNAGPGNIQKAKRLAKKLSLKTTKWEKNVEYAFIKLNRLEPVKYVSEIMNRYKSYKLIGY
tara:strand:+ start:29025 stop:30386 length:1362 start_codon:yes stop_codon:yes gene_type:complete